MTPTTTSQRLAALTGTAFFVLALLGRLAYPAAPAFADHPATVSAFYVHHATGVLAADTLGLVGVVFLLGFAGALRSALARVAGAESWLVATAFGATVAGAAMLVAAGAADAAAALRVQEQSAIDPPIAAAMWDLNHMLLGLAAPVALAAAVLATAAIALRTRVLPVWLGAVSLVLGVALVVPPIDYAAMIVFLFWTLAVSLVLAARAPRPAPVAVAGSVA